MRTSVRTLALGSLVTASLFITPAAFASTSDATATVSGGALTASATDVTLDGVTTSHTAQASAGSLTVSVNDATGTGDGWTVTQQVGEFTYSGDNVGTNINATNFSVTSVGEVALVAGADGVETVTAGTTGSLDTARTVLSATADGGEGSYTAPVNVQLDVPAGSREGVYSATLTTTTAAAPAL